MQQNQTWHTEPCYEAYLEHGVPSFVECTSPAIESHVSYGSGGGNNAVNQLYDTLVSCPNVRSLSLSIRQGGCVIGNDLFAFNWKEGDVFPPLQNLTLSGYDWDAQGRNGRSNVQSWKKAMDWSQLKRLDIDLPPRSFLEAFGGQLHGLESFTLRPKWSFWGDEVTLCGFDNATNQLRKNYTSFITTLPSLRELSISGMGELLNMTPILSQHGASLERLSIHEFERDCNYATGNATWTRPFLSIPDIEEIKRSAPYLQSLTLDIYRSANRWPTATLKALSTFPNLTDLTINFDLEDPWRTKYAEHCMVREEARDEYCGVNELMRPYLNKTTVTDIFQRLRRFGGHDGAKSNIQTLTLYAGDHGRQEGGGLRIPFHYEHPKPIKFKCWVDGNGTEECNGRVGDWWDSMRYGVELD
ncbi:hypothetical protein H2201_003264 [Coniosporium apollinis]|uniref:F-box domain-containing protein n=1 Tax=Coniosporium apollinis TaxID=61459 RepID=A0ABQ9NW51_9PEZI|nr:hypothetical protein H2201_003264 [Coniosporium apollinis]